MDGDPSVGCLRNKQWRGRSQEIGVVMRDFCHHASRVSVLFMFFVSVVGCGGNSAPACKLTAINVSPASATISHTAPPPGNTQHFDAFASAVTPGCVVAQSNLTT